jgi:hypothetical protein
VDRTRSPPTPLFTTSLVSQVQKLLFTGCHSDVCVARLLMKSETSDTFRALFKAEAGVIHTQLDLVYVFSPIGRSLGPGCRAVVG